MRASSFKACSNHVCRSFAQALARGNICFLRGLSPREFFVRGLSPRTFRFQTYSIMVLRGLSPREILLCVGLARAYLQVSNVSSGFCAGLAHANHSWLAWAKPAQAFATTIFWACAGLAHARNNEKRVSLTKAHTQPPQKKKGVFP